MLSDAARPLSGRIFSAAGPYVGDFPDAEERFLGYAQAASGIWEVDDLVSLLLEKANAESAAAELQ